MGSEQDLIKPYPQLINLGMECRSDGVSLIDLEEFDEPDLISV